MRHTVLTRRRRQVVRNNEPDLAWNFRGYKRGEFKVKTPNRQGSEEEVLTINLAHLGFSFILFYDVGDK
jgi:hypothetical protein